MTRPRRRESDRLINVRENWYRDVWLLIITATVVYLAFLSVGYSQQAANTARQIQAGRSAGVATTCAVLSAVAEAGREVIAGPSKLPPTREEQALERLGFPPFRIRHQEAEKAADAYVASLSRHVVSQVGARGQSLVRPGGRIDCGEFLKLANARP